MALSEHTSQFHESDWEHTLFPLETTSVLIRHGSDLINDLIYNRLLSPTGRPFQQQLRVYADKSGGHLRRTMKLDPAAEIFLYDIVYRNRNNLPRDMISGRTAYGYRFQNGAVVPPGSSYRDFRTAIRTASSEYQWSLSCDIASYFNSIYHHDMENFYRDYWSNDDVEHLGTFMRQANGGRSIDCVPQGIMPAKILGHHFLRFIDYSGEIRSERVFRFMDDIVLFSNSRQTLEHDFAVIQHLLGTRALNVNPRKTRIGPARFLHQGQNIDDVRRQLLTLRRERVEGYDNSGGDSRNNPSQLTHEQVDYLQGLLGENDIDEHDAELVLDLMTDYPDTVMEYIPDFLALFPNLSVSVHRFCNSVLDTDELANIILTFVTENEYLSEFQAFWLARIARSYLDTTRDYGAILHALYSHRSATVVSQAAILEIPDGRWGLSDLRRSNLRNGRSDWCGWAAAAGMRSENAAERNYVLGYFANSSEMNAFVADCIQRI